MVQDVSLVDSLRLRSVIWPADLGPILRLDGVFHAQELGFNLTFEGYVVGILAHFAKPTDPAKRRLWLADAERRLVGSVAIIKHAEDKVTRFGSLKVPVNGKRVPTRSSYEAQEPLADVDAPPSNARVSAR